MACHTNLSAIVEFKNLNSNFDQRGILKQKRRIDPNCELASYLQVSSFSASHTLFKSVSNLYYPRLQHASCVKTFHGCELSFQLLKNSIVMLSNTKARFKTYNLRSYTISRTNRTRFEKKKTNHTNSSRNRNQKSMKGHWNNDLN
jgi:hypothetical protein